MEAKVEQKKLLMMEVGGNEWQEWRFYRLRRSAQNHIHSIFNAQSALIANNTISKGLCYTTSTFHCTLQFTTHS